MIYLLFCNCSAFVPSCKGSWERHLQCYRKITLLMNQGSMRKLLVYMYMTSDWPNSWQRNGIQFKHETLYKRIRSARKCCCRRWWWQMVFNIIFSTSDSSRTWFMFLLKIILVFSDLGFIVACTVHHSYTTQHLFSSFVSYLWFGALPIPLSHI